MVVKSVFTHLPVPPALCDGSSLSLAWGHSPEGPRGRRGFAQILQEAVCSGPTVCLEEMAKQEGKKGGCKSPWEDAAGAALLLVASPSTALPSTRQDSVKRKKLDSYVNKRKERACLFLFGGC